MVCADLMCSDPEDGNFVVIFSLVLCVCVCVRYYNFAMVCVVMLLLSVEHSLCYCNFAVVCADLVWSDQEAEDFIFNVTSWCCSLVLL